MTPGARCSTIIEVYDIIDQGAKPADQIMHAYFRARKFIGSHDRKFITELLYDLLRHYGRLNWWAAKLGIEPNGRALLLLWLSLFEDRDNAEIYDLFSGAGYAPESLSRFERDIIDRARGQDLMPDDMPENIRVECPDWAYDGLKKHYGDGFSKELQAMMDEAPLDLRVNTLKAERDAVLKKLLADEFDVIPTQHSPIGMRVTGRPPFSAHAFYKNGIIEVQDEGSQILSLLCGVKAGEWVVDFCAGAGGKTLALAAQMQNKGRIWACDIEKNRLENSRLRLRRASVHCVQMQLLDDEEDDWVRKHAGKADCVLIDAPCTGIGTWRRNPFTRWQNLGPSLKALLKVQANILQSASRLVKPGGRLVYATCSMLPDENQKQMDSFLAQNPQFRQVALQDVPGATDLKLGDKFDLSQPMLQMTPARHQTDGFFLSIAKRV